MCIHRLFVHTGRVDIAVQTLGCVLCKADGLNVRVRGPLDGHGREAVEG